MKNLGSSESEEKLTYDDMKIIDGCLIDENVLSIWQLPTDRKKLGYLKSTQKSFAITKRYNFFVLTSTEMYMASTFLLLAPTGSTFFQQQTAKKLGLNSK